MAMAVEVEGLKDFKVSLSNRLVVVLKAHGRRLVTLVLPVLKVPEAIFCPPWGV